jgi:hypothetical protein
VRIRLLKYFDAREKPFPDSSVKDLNGAVPGSLVLPSRAAWSELFAKCPPLFDRETTTELNLIHATLQPA